MSLDILEKTQCISLYTYNQNGDRQDNITDWGLKKFKQYYNDIRKGLSPLLKEGKEINKEDIFYYVYGVLNNPKYREKYELNLKREFPRISFYNDFYQKVIDLLMVVTTVSIETMKIIQKMKQV
ncbi:MAG: hypothetical protein FWJ34_12705 [Geminocystis sp. GBBB08]|nr:hypothetical protein [Geminocystis sp. GBBB08]